MTLPKPALHPRLLSTLGRQVLRRAELSKQCFVPSSIEIDENLCVTSAFGKGQMERRAAPCGAQHPTAVGDLIQPHPLCAHLTPCLAWHRVGLPWNKWQKGKAHLARGDTMHSCPSASPGSPTIALLHLTVPSCNCK